MNLNDFSIEKLEEEFCESTMMLIRSLGKDFYIQYFIDTLSEDDIKKLNKFKLFDSFKSEMIDKFINNNLDEICEKLFFLLDIELDISNEEFFKQLNYEHIFKILISKLKNFFNTRSFKIIEEMEKKGIFKTSVIYPETVKKLNDSIGDTFKMKEQLDYTTRDYPFVDIDGNILTGKGNQTHAQLIQEYLDSLHINEALDDNFKRPSENEIEEILNNKYTAFGHIIDDNIFIDSFYLNKVSLDTVISDVKNSSISYNKIYDYDSENITRLAKVIK